MDAFNKNAPAIAGLLMSVQNIGYSCSVLSNYLSTAVKKPKDSKYNFHFANLIIGCITLFLNLFAILYPDTIPTWVVLAWDFVLILPFSIAAIITARQVYSPHNSMQAGQTISILSLSIFVIIWIVGLYSWWTSNPDLKFPKFA